MKPKGRTKQLMKQLFRPEFPWKQELNYLHDLGAVHYHWSLDWPEAHLSLDSDKAGDGYTARLTVLGVSGHMWLTEKPGELTWKAATPQEAIAKAIALANRTLMLLKFSAP